MIALLVENPSEMPAFQDAVLSFYQLFFFSCLFLIPLLVIRVTGNKKVRENIIMRLRILSCLAIFAAFAIFVAEQSFSQGNSGRHEVDVEFTTSYSPIWNDSGSGANANVSFWRPNITSGWSRVGHHISSGYAAPQASTMIVRPRTSGAIADPVDFSLIWTDAGSGANQQGSVWRPICRTGYQSLGDVTNGTHSKPNTTEMVCVHESALVRATPGNTIWNDAGSGATQDFGSWEIVPAAGDLSRGLFFGASSHSRPQPTIWAVRANPAQPASPSSDPVEEQFWDSVKNSSQTRDFQSYLSSFPNGKYAGLARLKVSQLGGTSSPVSTPTPVPTGNPSTSNVEEQYWDAVKNSSKAQDFQGYLDNYPSGKYVSIAKLKMSQLGGATTPPIVSPTPNPNTVSSGMTVEDQYWDTVKMSTRPQDFQAYLSSYPSGRYVALARLKLSQLGGTGNPAPMPTPVNQNPISVPTSAVELQYWDAVKNSQNANDYQSYLRDYPNGQFAPIARLKLQQLQGGGSTTQTAANSDDQYWNRISSSHRIQDFQGYLASFPNGKYSAIARLKISQLGGATTPQTGSGTTVEDQYWNNVKNSTRAMDYQQYLNNFPNGKYAAIARLRISQLSTPNSGGQGTSTVPPKAKLPTDDDFIRNAQPGSINELAQFRKFFVAGDDFSVKKAIAEAILKEIPQMEVALTEQDADFFILCNLTDSTTNAVITNDSSNPNLFGDFIVFTVVPTANNAPRRIRIQFRQKSGRSFGVFTDTPDVKLAKDFAKRLKKLIP
jgi:outer membrane protein assembly factor BamD (BamD/ComL family)